MRRAGQLAASLCVLAFVVALYGCGGHGGQVGGSVGTAGKPQPPPPTVEYSVVSLGSGSPGDMNDLGQIVGYRPATDSTPAQALLWEDNGAATLTPTVLPQPAGAAFASANSITNAGTPGSALIAGFVSYPNPENPGRPNHAAVVWQWDGYASPPQWVVTELPLPAQGGYTEAEARGVNTSGEVSGWVRRPVSDVTVEPCPAVWRRTVSGWDLPELLDTPGTGSRINEGGLVLVDIGSLHDCVWNSRAGGTTQLQNAEAALAISDLGGVSGVAQFTSKRKSFFGAALWSTPSASPTSLGALSGYEYSQANDLDDQGPEHRRAVGWCLHQAPNQPDANVAFRWQESEGMKDLNTLVPSGTAWIHNAYAINARGCITCSSYGGPCLLRPLQPTP